MRNLLVFRFGNGIFEPLWNRRYVDHVQITVAESIGIENRGAFYEETGAVRDVLQNHLLQLVSLIAMEPPATFDADALRDEKVKVLRAIADRPRRTPRSTSSAASTGRAGWRRPRSPATARRRTSTRSRRPRRSSRPASRSTTGAGPASRSTSGPASGCPKRATEIAIQYREVPHRLFRDAAVDPDPNLLVIRVQPDEGIMLRFGAKVPGLGMDVRAVTMDFTYGSAFSVDSPDAYETLILDALQGDASLFTRADEVEQAWGIVDPIIDAWADGPPPNLPELRRRHVGPGRGRRAPRRATAVAGGGSRAGEPWPSTCRCRSASPCCASRRVPTASPRSRAQLPGCGPRQDLTTTVEGEPARHIAARTSVMNLVVIARQPEIAEHCAATIQALTGRHPVADDDHRLGRPGRPVVAGRPGRGALRPAARGRARRPAPR